VRRARAGPLKKARDWGGDEVVRAGFRGGFHKKRGSRLPGVQDGLDSREESRQSTNVDVGTEGKGVLWDLKGLISLICLGGKTGEYFFGRGAKSDHGRERKVGETWGLGWREQSSAWGDTEATVGKQSETALPSGHLRGSGQSGELAPLRRVGEKDIFWRRV